MIAKTHPFSGSRQITFTSDGLTLTGTLHLPESPHPPIVIGCHGLLSNSDSPKQLALAKHCNTAGLAFFRFNHRGCGDSEGDLEKDTSFHGRCRDLSFALKKIMFSGLVGSSFGLFGSSLGGAVCLDLAGSYDIQAIVTFAAPLHGRLPGISTTHPKLAFNLSGRLSKIKNVHIFHSEHYCDKRYNIEQKMSNPQPLDPC